MAISWMQWMMIMVMVLVVVCSSVGILPAEFDVVVSCDRGGRPSSGSLVVLVAVNQAATAVAAAAAAAAALCGSRCDRC